VRSSRPCVAQRGQGIDRRPAAAPTPPSLSVLGRSRRHGPAAAAPTRGKQQKSASPAADLEPSDDEVRVPIPAVPAGPWRYATEQSAGWLAGWPGRGPALSSSIENGRRRSGAAGDTTTRLPSARGLVTSTHPFRQSWSPPAGCLRVAAEPSSRPRAANGAGWPSPQAGLPACRCRR
jgi:hypothetical protein